MNNNTVNIDILCDRFAKSYTYISDPQHREFIKKALEELLLYHNSNITNSNVTNELYFSVSQAIIVSKELELDSISIVASLLQNIPVSKKNIFPVGYYNQVNKLLGNINFLTNLKTNKISIDIDNFIHLILSVTNDIRVILIVLANKINLIRNLEKFELGKQKDIVFEVAQYYAPLAHRLGFYKIKGELENKAMQFSLPEIYKNLANQISKNESEHQSYFTTFLKPIKKILNQACLKYEVKTRTKSIPSIYNKMKAQKINFNEVYDLFAIRIILDSLPEKEKEDCWKVYSVITDLYPPHVERLRDWISIPRPNGYESLHITVDAPGKRMVEVQIRTKRMDENAENGMAAHWRYKENNSAHSGIEGWLREMKLMLENNVPTNYGELENKKINKDYIFVFTPDGNIKKLKNGATALDFAFEIHTEVGRQCNGAKVNNLFVPLKHVLKNGDHIEITTSKNQKPNVDWLNWAVTSKAINKIKQVLREQEYARAEQGKDILHRKLSQLKINYSDEVIKKLIAYYKAKNPSDLFHGFAEEHFEIQDIKHALTDTSKEEQNTVTQHTPVDPKINYAKNQYSILINEETVLNDVKFAKCCSPVYGDDIFGFVTVSDGIKIHRSDCTNAKEMQNRYAYRIIKAGWAKNYENQMFVATINIVGEDRNNVLNDITSLLANKFKINVKSINLVSKSGKISGNIIINVSNQGQLETILAKLMQIKGIKKASRELKS